MRKIGYAAIIAAAIILIAGSVARAPHSATASALVQTSSVMTPHDVESTIDVKALPNQDIDCRC